MSPLVSAEQVLNFHTRGLCDDPLCECVICQSMAHVVDECQLTRLHGGLRPLQSADEAAVGWFGKHRKCEKMTNLPHEQQQSSPRHWRARMVAGGLVWVMG